MTTKFVKNPISPETQRILRENFISGASVITNNNDEEDKKLVEEVEQDDYKNVKKVSKFKHIYLRIPDNYYEKIIELKELTGLSLNSICNESLIIGIQKKIIDMKILLNE